MTKLILTATFILAVTVARAQCEFGLEYESEERAKSEDISTITTDKLPSDFAMNANQIKTFFGVKASFRIYKEASNSSAKTLCKCTNDPTCDNIVFVGQQLLDDYENEFNKDGLWGIIAHELGHALQCRWNTQNFLTGVQRELHADFIAGYYLGVKVKIELTNIKQFADELFSRGDYKFNEKEHHGTPEQRVQYMLIGASLSMLTLQDAYNYCINYLRGAVGFFNINGIWNSRNNIAINMPVVLNVFTYYNQFYFQAINSFSRIPVAPQIAAVQIGVNQYRIIWPSTSPFLPGIVQDFIVINNGLIVVIQSNGFVDVLWR